MLVPISEMLDADSSFDLDPAGLSADPFYVDSLENDPLASSTQMVHRWRGRSMRRGTGSVQNCRSSR